MGDIKPWPNASGVDNDGGVETAEDECILIYQRLPNAPNARHVSVDADNNVWVAGYPFIPTTFYKLDSAIGSIMASFDASTIGCGGYGGLIDGNHVLWSASISQYSLLRYDLDAGTGVCLYAPNSYGLGIDTAGNVWNALYGFNLIYKFDPAGTQSGSFGTGSESRGVVITPADNNVWVANSGDNTVTRLDNTGSLLATIPAGVTPTGVAVDGDGKVWVTNLSSSNVMRIDPASNTVDLTVDLGAGAGPYNYSDMTGSTLTTPPNTGAWTVVHDTKEDPEQVTVSWNGSTPGDSSLTVTRACSSDGITFGAEQAVNNGVASPVNDCSYVKVSVAFQRSTTTDGDENGVKDSPVLYDLTISTNEPPICTGAYPSTSLIWPPNHKFVPVQILGITDPDGDPITVTPKSVFQDEPVQGPSSGNTSPDAALDPLAVRAERNGDPKTPGNGRVYHIRFTADDGQGGSCTGTVKICVPHDQGQGNACVDEGPLFNSLAP